MDIHEYMLGLGRAARDASVAMAAATTAQKNDALQHIGAMLKDASDELIAANREDLTNNPHLDPALRDRLELTDPRLAAMIDGVQQVAALADPIGEVSNSRSRPSGIEVAQMRVPLGVVGIIYESRPNVTADAAALCLKSGNATILRGGSEAIRSNQAIAACVQRGLAKASLPETAVQVVATPDREAVGQLLGMQEFVDVLVPRGGKGLIERVSKDAAMPVIKHLDGVCHVYLDHPCDLEMATEIAINAKTQRYGTCNTMETLLVHAEIAPTVLPDLCSRYKELGVECRGCDKTRAIVAGITAASEDDWYEEYLAPILAIRVVDDLEQAIAHIRQFGSQHTDAIVTRELTNATHFVKAVDSSSVMVNTSTRFADGYEYGLGAEIGISTDKFHARGPVGLHGLTSLKYVVFSDGAIRT